MIISTAITKWLDTKRKDLSASTISDIERIEELTHQLGYHRKSFSDLNHTQRLTLSRKGAQNTGLRRSAIQEFLTIIETWAEDETTAEADADADITADDTAEETDETDEADGAADETAAEEVKTDDDTVTDGDDDDEADAEAVGDTEGDGDDAEGDSGDAADADAEADGDEDGPLTPSSHSIFNTPKTDTDSSETEQTKDTESHSDETGLDEADFGDVEPMAVQVRPVTASSFADTLNAETTPENSFLETLEGSSISQDVLDSTAADSADAEPVKPQVDYVMYFYFAVSIVAICLSIYFFLRAQS